MTSQPAIPADKPLEPVAAASAPPTLQAAGPAVKRSMPMALSITLGILGAAFFIWFFYYLAWFFLLLYLSFVIATILDAPVVWLKRFHLGRTLATVLVMFGGVLLFAAAVFLLSISVYNQIRDLAANLQQVPAAIQGFLNSLAERFPAFGDRLRNIDVIDTFAGLLPQVGVLYQNAVTGFTTITYIVVVFFTVMYMVIDGPDHLRAARRVFPRNARLEITSVFEEMATAHRRWFVASTTNVISAAILTTIGLYIVGVPGAPVLGIIAGFGELVPNIGPFFGALPTVLLVLLTNPDKFLWVVLMFLIVQTIQSYTITPYVMKIGVKLPVLATIVSVLVMTSLFGLLGVFVAIPLTADMVVLWNYINRRLEKESTDQDLANPPPSSERIAAGTPQSVSAARARRWPFHRRGREPSPPSPPSSSPPSSGRPDAPLPEESPGPPAPDANLH